MVLFVFCFFLVWARLHKDLPFSTSCFFLFACFLVWALLHTNLPFSTTFAFCFFFSGLGPSPQRFALSPHHSRFVFFWFFLVWASLHTNLPFLHNIRVLVFFGFFWFRAFSTPSRPQSQLSLSRIKDNREFATCLTQNAWFWPHVLLHIIWS